MLIRNIPDDLKQKLAVRAIENKRSQSAEVIAVLQEALDPQPKKSWVMMLRETAEEVGGFELERPTWKSREFSFDSE